MDAHAFDMGQGVICLRDVIMSHNPSHIFARVMSHHRVRGDGSGPESARYHINNLGVDLSIGGRRAGKLYVKVHLSTRDYTGTWNTTTVHTTTSTNVTAVACQSTMRESIE